MTDPVVEELLAIATAKSGLSATEIKTAVVDPNWSVAAIGWSRNVLDELTEIWGSLSLEGKLVSFCMAQGFSPFESPALEE